MIQVICDNCGRELKNAGDEINPDRESDKHCTLTLKIEGLGKIPVFMDLCIVCAKKYLSVLSQPI